MSIDAELKDPELDVWREQWQSDATVPLHLRTQVARQSHLMKIGLMMDSLVTLVIGGGAILWALRSPQPGVLLVPVATWIFLAAAWAFVLTANRGNWKPSTLDTAAFLDISIRPCRTSLSPLSFAVILFLCEIAFSLGWVYINTDEPRKSLFAWLMFSSLRIDVVWLCTFAFFGGTIWYRRRKRAELASLFDLRREISPTVDRDETPE